MITIFFPLWLISQEGIPQPRLTMRFMTNNFLLSSIPSMNGIPSWQDPHILLRSYLITKTFSTSPSTTYSIIVKPADLNFCHALTSRSTIDLESNVKANTLTHWRRESEDELDLGEASYTQTLLKSHNVGSVAGILLPDGGSTFYSLLQITYETDPFPSEVIWILQD
jgi:hypothetical protein